MISWTTVTWSMIAGICMTMAGVHLLVWLKDRDSRTSLAFALAAIGAAATAVFELALMHSQTPAQYGEILRWLHVPVFLLVISYVSFVRSYLNAGRAWLLWSYVAVRVLILIVDLVSVPNIGFQEINSLHFIPTWGDTFAVPVGIMSPRAYLIRLSEVQLLLFIADATYAAWSKGKRKQAVLAGAAFFMAAGIVTTLSIMLVKGTLRVPLTLSMPFLLSTLVMGVDMSLDLLRVQKISRELLLNQERMQLVLKATNLGLWEWDIEKNEIWATDSSRARVGVGNNEKISLERFLKSVHPDDREPVGKSVQHAVESLDDIAMEYRTIAPDGAVQWIAASGHVEHNEKGKAVRVRGVTMDITNEKRSETERIQLRLELAHLSRVLTMSELSSSLAHEINQPLGAILNNAAAAKMLHAERKGGEGGEIGEILDDIISDTNRAGQIVRKIRGIIKKENVVFEPLDINTLIREVVALFQNPLARERISVREELSPDLSPVKGDRVRLQQVVMNLIMNATDAMKGSSSRILTIRTIMDGPNKVLVSVSDTGPGIDDKMKEKLFEPFTTTKKDGLGMGLRICRSILEDHGGSIQAMNNPEGGATFAFLLRTDDGGKG